MIDKLLTFERSSQTLTADAYIGDAIDTQAMSELTPTGGGPLYFVLAVTAGTTAAGTSGAIRLSAGAAIGNNGDITGSADTLFETPTLTASDLAKGKVHAYPLPYPNAGRLKRYLQPYWDASTNAAGLKVDAYLTTKPEYLHAHPDAVN